MGGSHCDDSKKDSIQAWCAAVNLDYSSVVTAPDEIEVLGEMGIDVIEVDVATGIAIIKDAKGFHFLQTPTQ